MILEQEELWFLRTHNANGHLVIRGNKVIDCAAIFRKHFLGKGAQVIINTAVRRGWSLRTPDIRYIPAYP